KARAKFFMGHVPVDPVGSGRPAAVPGTASAPLAAQGARLYPIAGVGARWVISRGPGPERSRHKMVNAVLDYCGVETYRTSVCAGPGKYSGQDRFRTLERIGSSSGTRDSFSYLWFVVGVGK